MQKKQQGKNVVYIFYFPNGSRSLLLFDLVKCSQKKNKIPIDPKWKWNYSRSKGKTTRKKRKQSNGERKRKIFILESKHLREKTRDFLYLQPKECSDRFFPSVFFLSLLEKINKALFHWRAKAKTFFLLLFVTNGTVFFSYHDSFFDNHGHHYSSFVSLQKYSFWRTVYFWFLWQVSRSLVAVLRKSSCCASILLSHNNDIQPWWMNLSGT